MYLTTIKLNAMKKIHLLLIAILLFALNVRIANAACTPSFTASINNFVVTFTNTSTTTSGFPNKIIYGWNFGDNTYSSDKNPVKTYTSSGYKVVSLFMNDSFGCVQTFTDTILITAVGNFCNASFTKSFNGLSVYFQNTSKNRDGLENGLTFLWNFGDGTTSIATHPYKVFATPGKKIVRLDIKDSVQACFATRIDTFYVHNASTCNASYVSSRNGMTLNFINTSTTISSVPNKVNYYWEFGDGSVSNLKDPVKTYSIQGAWRVVLRIQDSLGCSDVVSDTVFVSATGTNCKAAFSKSVNGLLVNFNSTSLNSTGSSVGLNYLWSFGDSTTSTQKNPVKTYLTNGPKLVKLTISDSTRGCSDSYYDSLFLVGPTVYCSARFEVGFDTTTPFQFYILNTSFIRPNSTFLWNFGDGGSSTVLAPSHTYANFGSYLVCLTVSDSMCTSTFCDSVGMDSSGTLLKQGKFGFKTLDYTTLLSTTGNNAVNSKLEYSVFPNPTSSQFTIELNLKSISQVKLILTDLSGKVLLDKEIQAISGLWSESINLSELQPAIYLLHIQTNEGFKTSKIIRN